MAVRTDGITASMRAHLEELARDGVVRFAARQYAIAQVVPGPGFQARITEAGRKAMHGKMRQYSAKAARRNRKAALLDQVLGGAEG